ncbi:MAG TPA: hypothetical protein VJX94_08535 [Stellaceae bacterium]|nr:hypothetical protein [Stellaceae bacterium]
MKQLLNLWFRANARLLLPLIPAIALTMLLTNVSQAALANFAVPGSVIVFPKFQQGTVVVNDVTLPSTEIHVGAVCPSDETPSACANEKVTILFNWVCPGYQTTGGYVCESNDFIVTISVNGEAVFYPGTGTSTYTPLPGLTVVPYASCSRGYLIGVVINNRQQLARFDGLIGNAVLRNAQGIEEAYSALAIQADPNTPEGNILSYPGAPFSVTDVKAQIVFDGGPGHYLQPPGQFSGEVAYDSDVKAPFTDTQLILLTLDVVRDGFNPSTTVNLNFYADNQDEIASVNTSFICWEEVKLSSNFASPSNAWLSNSLTAAGAASAGGTSNTGVVTSGQAFRARFPNLQHRFDVSLLALVETTSGLTAGPQSATQSHIFQTFNNSLPIAATFSYP